jgi:hypothetical protein
MRTKIIAILCLALLPFSMVQAKGAKSEKSGPKVLTGISGGLSVHGGYLFAQSPDQLFSNTGLGDINTILNLKKDGFCYGFGAQLRIHFIDHIHLGAEANISTLPLMSSGSNVQQMWAGGFCDFYGGWGKTKPMIGLGVGGGKVKRLYVPDANVVSEPTEEAGSSTNYNAAYTTTPFFYLDPYVGIETDFGLLGLQFKIDYLLPFGNPTGKLVDAGKNVSWSNFLSPSGPRLHIVLLFGKL